MPCVTARALAGSSSFSFSITCTAACLSIKGKYEPENGILVDKFVKVDNDKCVFFMRVMIRSPAELTLTMVKRGNSTSPILFAYSRGVRSVRTVRAALLRDPRYGAGALH